MRAAHARADADYVAQHETELNQAAVILNSVGGDVAAAMKIGRIIRDREANTSTDTNGKCFSSCVLIYIAGVKRDNSGGVIGLHRPFFSLEPINREQIERAEPIMLQEIKAYVREMGVSDAFYDAMVNTEVADVRLYRGNEINKLVPRTDPTYDEIENAYDAREYGISTGEMRERKLIAKQKCIPNGYYANVDAYNRQVDCIRATYWGLDLVAYERARMNCHLSYSEDEWKLYDAADAKKRRDLPFVINKEACIRDAMHIVQ